MSDTQPKQDRYIGPVENLEEVEVAITEWWAGNDDFDIELAEGMLTEEDVKNGLEKAQYLHAYDIETLQLLEHWIGYLRYCDERNIIASADEFIKATAIGLNLGGPTNE